MKYFTLNSHRVVYGGGGIMPDIFVPLDTTENSEYLHNLSGKGIFNEFVTGYLERNRDKVVKAYPDFASFNKNFIVDENIMNQFADFGEKNGVKKDPRGMRISGKFMAMEIKALVARQIFHNEGFFQIINQDNDILKKAVEALKGNTYSNMKITE